MRKMPSSSQKFEAKIYAGDFCTRKLWAGELSRYAATSFNVALSPSRSDITRFRPWSPIAPDRKSFGSRRKNSKFAQKTSNVVFDPCSGMSGPTSRRCSACTNLHE